MRGNSRTSNLPLPPFTMRGLTVPEVPGRSGVCQRVVAAERTPVLADVPKSGPAYRFPGCDAWFNGRGIAASVSDLRRSRRPLSGAGGSRRRCPPS